MSSTRIVGSFLMVAGPVAGIAAALVVPVHYLGLALIVGGFLLGVVLYTIGEWSDTSRIAPPAGWYRDQAGQKRWWDGHHWTGYVAP
jgi:hypothetical protein